MAQDPASLSFLPPGFRPRGPDIVLPQESGDIGGDGGGAARGPDPGTVDPAKISARRGKGRRKGWSPERRAAYEARRSTSGSEEEELVVDEEKERKPKPVPHEVVEQVAAGLKFVQSLMTPDMPLSDDEAEGLSKAITNVLAYYIKMGGGGRGMAWLALFGCLAMIELPRMMVVSARNKESRTIKTPPPANIVVE
jgi:hypothetical protein